MYNMLREEVPKSKDTLEKRMQVVITSGVSDKLRRAMLFSSNCVYRNKFFSGMPTRPFAILYIMHCLASFLQLNTDLEHIGYA